MKPTTIIVRTASYEFAHGKKPRGAGGWFFFADRRQGFDQPFFQITAPYGEARRAAQRWAAEQGFGEIYVGS